MSGNSEMNDCAVKGKYLSMKDFSLFDNCDINSIGEGISVVGETHLSNKAVEGEGSIYGDRVSILAKTKREKGGKDH